MSIGLSFWLGMAGGALIVQGLMTKPRMYPLTFAGLALVIGATFFMHV